MTTVLSQENMIAFFENGKFIQFVEKKGACIIIKEARDAGLGVQDFGDFFNVVVR